MLQYKQGVDILSDLGGIDSIAKAQELFKQKLSPEHLRRLGRISCEEALLKVANAIALCDPDAVFICHCNSPALLADPDETGVLQIGGVSVPVLDHRPRAAPRQ